MPHPGSPLAGGQLRALVESLPVALLQVQSGGFVLFANRAARAELGLPATHRTHLGLLGPIGLALHRALEELPVGAAAAPEEHRLRLVVPERGAWRVGVFCTSPDCLTLLVRAEVLRDPDLHRGVVDLLGVTADDARLAVRVYRGLTCRALAAGFGVPEHAVRKRLSRLYARLGLRGRADLIRAVGAVASPLHQRPEPCVTRGDLPRGAPAAPERGTVGELTLAPAGLAGLDGVLHRVDVGLAALDDAGRLLCCNRAAAGLLFPAGCAGGPLATTHPEIVRAAGTPSLRDDGAVVRLRLGRAEQPGTLRVALWRAAAGLLGMQVRREQLRAGDVEALLVARFGLTARQASLALLLWRGHTNTQVARALGIAENTVHSFAAVVYGKLGVRSRGDLVAVIDELAGGAGRD